MGGSPPGLRDAPPDDRLGRNPPCTADQAAAKAFGIQPAFATLVIDAIKAQNEEHAHITIVQIGRPDAGFIERTDKKLIESTMNNPLAAFPRDKKVSAGGVIFEIFIVDNKGLDVAQTDPTLQNERTPRDVD